MFVNLKYSSTLFRLSSKERMNIRQKPIIISRYCSSDIKNSHCPESINKVNISVDSNLDSDKILMTNNLISFKKYCMTNILTTCKFGAVTVGSSALTLYSIPHLGSFLGDILFPCFFVTCSGALLSYYYHLSIDYQQYDDDRKMMYGYFMHTCLGLITSPVAIICYHMFAPHLIIVSTAFLSGIITLASVLSMLSVSNISNTTNISNISNISTIPKKSMLYGSVSLGTLIGGIACMGILSLTIAPGIYMNMNAYLGITLCNILNIYYLHRSLSNFKYDMDPISMSKYNISIMLIMLLGYLCIYD